jgi:hypothetical protein
MKFLPLPSGLKSKPSVHVRPRRNSCLVSLSDLVWGPFWGFQPLSLFVFIVRVLHKYTTTSAMHIEMYTVCVCVCQPRLCTADHALSYLAYAVTEA